MVDAPITADGIHLLRAGRIIATVGGPESGLTLGEAKELAADIARRLRPEIEGCHACGYPWENGLCSRPGCCNSH